MKASSPSLMPALRTSEVNEFFLSERAWKLISSPVDPADYVEASVDEALVS